MFRAVLFKFDTAVTGINDFLAYTEYFMSKNDGNTIR